MAATPWPEGRKRPWRVTFLALGVLTLGLLNLWRAVGLAGQVELLTSLGVQLDPRLRLLMALMWALLFGVLAVALWRGWVRGPAALPWALILYALYRLLLLAFYIVSPAAQARWPGVLLAHAAGLALALWATHSAPGRVYFGLPPRSIPRPPLRRTAPNEKSHV